MQASASLTFLSLPCSVVCVLSLRSAPVSFLHVDTGKRLYTRRADIFDNANCRGCPIVGQLEISAHTTGVQDPNAMWTADDGIYFPVMGAQS